MNKLINFFKDEEGATAVEYGLLVCLIAAAIVGTVKLIGGQTQSGFSTVNTALTGAGINPPAAAQ